jgi:very-short-patch-repair endonuclease
MRAPRKTFIRARRLRRAMTLPEVLLWQALRGADKQGLRWRRQHPIGPYVLDFYLPAAKLAVEVDGAAHDVPDQVRHDAARDDWLGERGIHVLRLNAVDVLDARRRDDALLTIEATALSL